MITGLQYPLALSGSNIETVSDTSLAEAHIRFCIDAYLPSSYTPMQSMPSPVILAEDLRLVLLQYIPEADINTEAKVSSDFDGRLDVTVNWVFNGQTGNITIVV